MMKSPLASAIATVLLVACGGASSPSSPSSSGAPEGAGTSESPSPPGSATNDGAAPGPAPSSLDASVADAGSSRSDAAANPDAGPPPAAGEGGASGARVAVPMYLDPSESPSMWTEVFAAGGAAVGLLVVNPDSGPGASADATYTAAIAQAHAAGEVVLGYIHSSSTQRAIADVEADVSSWYSFYPALDGIFVDEVSDDDATATTYYLPLYTFIKAKSAKATVAINPGTMVGEAFMQASDILLTYEDTYADYIDPSQNPPNPAWVAKYAPSRFWNIIHTTPANVEANAIALARGRNAGWIYVTAEGPATAYQTIETGAYWNTEITDVTAP